MTRRPALAVLALTALLCAAAAAGVGTRYQERRRQLEAQAEAQRKKLGLDGDRAKLFAQYPTPEVQFGEEPVQLTPGATGTVRVAGSFPKGSVFFFSSDDVQVVKESAGAAGWEAQVKVAAAALPGDVALNVQAPVSGAERSGRSIAIRGRYALEVRFEDGYTASLQPEKADDSGAVQCALEWRKPGEKKPFRSVKATVDQGAPLRVSVMPTEEDLALLTSRIGAAQQVLQDPEVQRQIGAFGRKIEACSKLPQPQMMPCMEKAGKENQEFQARIQAKAKQADDELAKKLPPGPVLCGDWRLDGSDGKVEGEASCPDDKRVKLSGTIRYVGPLNPGQ